MAKPKIFETRKLAVGQLRELGVAPSKFTQYVKLRADGQYDCDIDQAKADLAATPAVGKVKKPAAKKAPAKKAPAKKAPAKKAPAKKKAAAKKAADPKKDRVSVSSTCREMILAGKTNEQIWKVIQKEFNLDDSKKYYPAWNRSDMKKRGLIK